MRSTAYGWKQALVFGSVALGLAACGGGGGKDASPNNTNRDFKLELSADSNKTLLALNIQDLPPDLAAPHTTRLSLRMDPMPGGGTDGGNCWTATFDVLARGAGTDAARLYPYGATAGIGSSQYFTVSTSGTWNVVVNAKDRVGTVTIEATVPDPNYALVRCNDDKVEIGARYPNEPIRYMRKSIDLQVGGASTGRPAQIVINRRSVYNDQPVEFLYFQGQNDPTSMRVQAEVIDEAGQPVPNPANNNVEVRLLNAGNSGAYLQSGGQVARGGGSVFSRTINGQGLFTLHSGTSATTLLVEVRTDRADNNVDNGIQDLIYNVATVPLVSADPNPGNLPLSLDDPAATAICRGQTNTIPFTATGGTIPYKFTAQATQNLPAGLSFLTQPWIQDGTATLTGISGNTSAAAGTDFQVNVGVRDSAFPTKGEAAKTLAFTVVTPPEILVDSGSSELQLNGAPDIRRLGTPIWTSSSTVFRVSGNFDEEGLPDGSARVFTPAQDQVVPPVCNRRHPDTDPSEPLDLYVENVVVTVTFAGGCVSTATLPMHTDSCLGQALP